MLSASNLESLIAIKRREIEKEKSVLGLTTSICQHLENDKENIETNTRCIKKVNFIEETQTQEHHDSSEDQEKNKELQRELEEIPPDLERYIRRYLGLPVMLKAGEYSPNNPLVRSERAVGDALLGLGEYERRRNTLRKIRQHEYKEYLDQQAKKKQEAKEQAERERREREQKEREREEREREILLERDSFSPDRRRSVPVNIPLTTACRNSKVDTGVQVEDFNKPLSVAVQTDETELFGNVQCRGALTQAERELSPRGATDVPRRRSHGDYDRLPLPTKSNREKLTSDLRHTYMPSIFDAEAIKLRNMQAEKEAAERRQFYQQELKNQILEQQRIREERKSREKMLEQAEMRRLEEQLRMLRLAQEGELDKQHEMNVTVAHSTADYNTKRRALQKEIDAEKHKFLRAVSQPIKNFPKRNTATSKSDTPSKLPFYYPKVYETSNEFTEKKPYSMNIPENSIFSANYDVDSYLRRNLNFNNDKIHNYDNGISKKSENKFNHDERINDSKLPRFEMRYKSNMEDLDTFNRNEIQNFNAKHNTERNQDIRTKNDDRSPSITQKDNNYSKTIANNKTDAKYIENPHEIDEIDIESDKNERNDVNRNVMTEKTLIHDRPNASKPSVDIDSLPIPVLRHTPQSETTEDCRIDMSEAMKKVDDKWQVPAVQKNILKALPTQEGKSISILTQLGSIRRQLQLEQLKLDRMMKKDD